MAIRRIDTIRKKRLYAAQCEPCTGVQEIRDLLLKLKEEGKTILLASHNREDIEVLCDTVHEMDKGVLVNDEEK